MYNQELKITPQQKHYKNTY